MSSRTRRGLATVVFGVALVVAGVALLRLATLTQDWLLVLLSLPLLFVGLMRVADGVPKRGPAATDETNTEA